MEPVMMNSPEKEALFLLSYHKIKEMIGEICNQCMSEKIITDDDCSCCTLDLFEDVLGDLFKEGQIQHGKSFILS